MGWRVSWWCDEELHMMRWKGWSWGDEKIGHEGMGDDAGTRDGDDGDDDDDGGCVEVSSVQKMA